MSARTGAGTRWNRSSSLNRRSTRLAASCCHPLFWPPGSNSKTSRKGGRAPLAKALHKRGVKPAAPVIALAHSTGATSAGAVGCPSNWCSHSMATDGCLSRIIWRQSAQLAQHAGTRTRSALRKPNPPKINGNPALSRTSSPQCDKSCSRMLPTH